MSNLEKEDKMPQRKMRGPNRGGSFEKPKNLSLTVKKLMSYLKSFMPFIVIALIFSVASSILSIIGPNKLSDLTDELSKGLILDKKKIEVINKDISSTLNEESIKEITTKIYKNEEISGVSKEDKEKARRQMRHLELENLASRSFGALSGGQQQRVLIARALCATESLLILDEPVTGLDPAVTRELYEILEKLNKKEHTAIVMVTHDIAGALPYADKVLHIGPQGYFFGTRREYCASEEGKRMLGTAFREEEEK